MSEPQGAVGVIHDLGYRRYDGPRLDRAGIIRALYWHSLRSAFGIGRGVKAKIVPILTFVLMCLPAVVNAIVDALRPFGVRDVTMPCTPERVWRAIQAATEGANGGAA